MNFKQHLTAFKGRHKQLDMVWLSISLKGLIAIGPDGQTLVEKYPSKGDISSKLERLNSLDS